MGLDLFKLLYIMFFSIDFYLSLNPNTVFFFGINYVY